MPEIPSSIGKRIKTIREKTGLSAENFAELMGEKTRTYWSYERDETKNLPFDFLQLLAARFSVNLHWLITGEEAKPQEVEIDVSKVDKIIFKFKNY